MTVARPGIPKFNMPKTSSPKASVAANLGSASRSTGVSYGIFAQRTLTGSGIHLNNRLFNNQSLSAARHALNDNRTVLFNNNIGMPHKCNHGQNDNTMNDYMKAMMTLNMLKQTAAQVGETIKSISGNETDDVVTPKKAKPENVTKNDVGKTYVERLESSKSFADIKGIEKELGGKLGGFDTEYQKIGKDADVKQALALNDEATAGFELLGINTNTIAEGLKLSNLSLKAESSINDIEKEAGKIDNDKKDLDAYKGDQGPIGTAKQKVSQGIQTREGQLTKAQFNLKAAETTLNGLKEGDAGYAAAKTNYDNAKAEVERLNKEIKELKQAKAALEAAEAKVKVLIKDLDTKKAELNDIKKAKENFADKKYNLAKSQLETLNKNGRTMRDLDKEINALIGKTDDKSVNGLRNKINEYNKLVPVMAQAYNSLTSLGNELQDIKDAKGNKLQVPSSLDSYAKCIIPKAQVSANFTAEVDGNKNKVGGGASNAQVMSNIDNCKTPYQTIKFGSTSYTLLEDGTFRSDDGGIFNRDQLKRIVNNDNLLS